MPTIGYGYEVIKPDYQANLQNVDLISKVLMFKQNEFNQAYAGLKDLQRQSLGISFINKKEQSKIDAFNSQVNLAFANGEFGDLSNADVANKYYAMFDRIGQDQTLIGRYRQDNDYRKQLQAVEAKRTAKDPAKAGFGAINYDNFMSRLNDYSELDLDSPDAEGFVLRPYTDYIDINKELADRMKEVPIQKFSIPEVKNGQIITRTYSGRDPEAVRAAAHDYLSSRGVSQLREQAEYTFRQAGTDPSFQQSIYNDHVTYNQRTQKAIQAELDKVMEDIKTKTNPTEIAALAEQQTRLESQLAQNSLSLKSADEYFNRDSSEIINDIASIVTNDVIDGTKATYGGYAISTKVEPDRTFLELAKMQQRADEFKINTQLEVAKMQQDAELAGAKLEFEKTKAGEVTAKNLMSDGTPAPNYFSTSDPTHIDFVSTVDSLNATTQKLYALQANIFRDGITHGDNPMSGENFTLEMLIDPKSVDKFSQNPYYGESPYFKAFLKAKDELYTTDRALAEYMGKRPTNNYEWDRLKEAGSKIRARVEQIMTSPKDRDEAQFANYLQDVNANLLSLQEFMTEANASGSPEEYIKNKQNIKIYSNAVYDFDLPENASKGEKARLAQMEELFRPTFENYIDVPAAVYNSKSTNVSQDTWDKSFTDPARVRNIPYGQIRKIESGPDGTLKVFMKDSAFAKVEKDGTEDPLKSGIFASDDKYMMVKNGGYYQQVKASDIKAKGYFEIKDPRFNKLNWSNQLGYTVGAKPQKRWDVTADGQSVSFETRRSTVNNHVQASVNGGPWIEYPTSDVTAVITQLRQRISTATLQEITSQ